MFPEKGGRNFHCFRTPRVAHHKRVPSELQRVQARLNTRLGQFGPGFVPSDLECVFLSLNKKDERFASPEIL